MSSTTWDADAVRAELVESGWLTVERYAELAAAAFRHLEDLRAHGIPVTAVDYKRCEGVFDDDHAWGEGVVFGPPQGRPASVVRLVDGTRVPMEEYLDVMYGADAGDRYRAAAQRPPRAAPSEESAERRRMMLASRLISAEQRAAMEDADRRAASTQAQLDDLGLLP